jgi:hypothetical protein
MVRIICVSEAKSKIPDWWNKVDSGIGLAMVNVLGVYSESIATLPPFDLIEDHKLFFPDIQPMRVRKKRFAFISFGKIQFLPP